ncbi:MAG: single-stranded DNA-binding protein [Finegoldia sp.]|nr:single-stranded DNA-binding protein [Finegoldia sp.]
MNRVNLFGRLTKDVDLKYTNNNMAIGRFSLAVDRRLSREKKQEAQANNQPTADFISCVVFGKTAEMMARYTGKGLRVVIGGHIQTGSYVNQNDQRVYTTDVIVDEVNIIDFAQDNQNPANNPNNDKGYTESNDLDDLPFNDDLPF